MLSKYEDFYKNSYTDLFDQERTNDKFCLRTFALQALKNMYMAEKEIFVFSQKRTSAGLKLEGESIRYTAIAIIGLASEKKEIVDKLLSGITLQELCLKLLAKVGNNNLGNLALTLWAAIEIGIGDTKPLISKIARLDPPSGRHSTVETAWALSALSLANIESTRDLCKRIAESLTISFNPQTGIFPHIIGKKSGLRSHVSCFADLVYPIQALSYYFRISQAKKILEIATICANRICQLQGEAGQWWWHYDFRTGKILEGYPVYSVHQDAMAPMALIALHRAGGPDYSGSIKKGINWIFYSKEIQQPLIDKKAGVIWRKVNHREAGKLCRFVQAFVSRINPRFRVPGLARIFPPVAIDYECRPYHLGWLLYAMKESRNI